MFNFKDAQTDTFSPLPCGEYLATVNSFEKKISKSGNVYYSLVINVNNKKVFEGICRDVSVGGMQVLIDQFPGKAGEKISINVHPENSDYHFVASGQIVRLLEGNNGFSFRFQQLSDEAKKAIEKYVVSEAN